MSRIHSSLILALCSCGTGTGGAASTGDGGTTTSTTSALDSSGAAVTGTSGSTGAAASTGEGSGPGPTTTADASGSSSGVVEPEDPTFAFAVIPDTQNETLNDTNTDAHFVPRIEWILDNREALDIRFALQTGDLCNWDTPRHDQYARASEGFSLFDDAAFPYALAIGNHDTAATCPGGSACPGDTHAHQRDTSTFNQFFPTTRFPTLVDTFEPDKVDNAFHTFHAGGVDWIVISMELWAREEAYQWVGQVLAEHPHHNGIVFTHDHLTGAGEIQTSNGGYGDTSPRQIFDDVLSQHANLRFVFSGHEGKVAFRQDTGAMGNAIYQFLFNIDDTTNPTRIISIDTDARTIDAYVYGPATDFTYDDPGATVHLDEVDFVH